MEVLSRMVESGSQSIMCKVQISFNEEKFSTVMEGWDIHFFYILRYDLSIIALIVVCLLIHVPVYQSGLY